MKRLVVIAGMSAAFVFCALSHGGDDAAAIKGLLERLRKGGDDRVAAALARHGAAAVPGLIEVLKEGNAEVQIQAMSALGQIGPAAKAAVPVLSEGLTETSDDKLAAASAQALGRIGAAGMPVLLIVLEKGKPERAVLAARAIEKVGPAAGKAAETLLVKHLKAAKEPPEAIIYIDALVSLGAGAKGAVPVLIEIGKAKKKTPAQIHVLVGLGKIGPAAKEASPYLAEVMTDPKEPPHLRIHARQSLSQIDPSSKAIADTLPEIIKGGIWPRPILIEALAHIGPVNKEARTVLEEGVSSKDPTTRVYAAWGLGKADSKDRAVVSVLIESLGEKDAKVRVLAARAIGEVRPMDPAIGRALEKAAEDSNPAVRQAVAAALKKLK